jgi:hypothetical protein
MPNFGKPALLYTHYKWTDTEQSKRYIHFSNDDVVDLENGYHVLDFINRFMMFSGLISQESFNRIEMLLCQHMPKKIRTRGEMKLWVSKNWNTRF